MDMMSIGKITKKRHSKTLIMFSDSRIDSVFRKEKKKGNADPGVDLRFRGMHWKKDFWNAGCRPVGATARGVATGSVRADPRRDFPDDRVTPRK